MPRQYRGYDKWKHSQSAPGGHPQSLWEGLSRGTEGSQMEGSDLCLFIGRMMHKRALKA